MCVKVKYTHRDVHKYSARALRFQHYQCTDIKHYIGLTYLQKVIAESDDTLIGNLHTNKYINTEAMSDAMHSYAPLQRWLNFKHWPNHLYPSA